MKRWLCLYDTLLFFVKSVIVPETRLLRSEMLIEALGALMAIFCVNPIDNTEQQAGDRKVFEYFHG